MKKTKILDPKDGEILRVPVKGELETRTVKVWFCPYVHYSYILRFFAKEMFPITKSKFASKDVKRCYPDAKIRVYGKCLVRYTTPKLHQNWGEVMVVNNFPIISPDEAVKIIIHYDENNDIPYSSREFIRI